MPKNSKPESLLRNPALKPLSVLVGTWDTVATHPLFPDTSFHGRVFFKWIEGGAFLIMRSDIEEPEIPNSVAVIGSDGSAAVYSMLYFDVRKVSRIYEMTLIDNVWKIWRNSPGFSQRFTGSFADEDHTIIGVWELSQDDSIWKRDLELTYKRVK